MNFAKCLAILLLISTYSFSQDTSFSAKIEVRNNSAAVDDVSAKVIVNGGVEPYKYVWRSEEHTSELQSRPHLVCRLLLEKKKKKQKKQTQQKKKKKYKNKTEKTSSRKQ